MATAGPVSQARMGRPRSPDLGSASLVSGQVPNGWSRAGRRPRTDRLCVDRGHAESGGTLGYRDGFVRPVHAYSEPPATRLWVAVTSVAWFLPGVALSVAIALYVAGSVARRLRGGSLAAWLLIVGTGMILSATVTPIRSIFEDVGSVGRTCDFMRLGLVPLDQLLTIGDSSLNVVLFMPLGLGLGLIPNSGRKVALVLAGLALPFAIETFQLLVPILGRGCESADVIDNLSGLVVGLGAGTVGRRLRTGRRRVDPTEPGA